MLVNVIRIVDGAGCVYYSLVGDNDTFCLDVAESWNETNVHEMYGLDTLGHDPEEYCWTNVFISSDRELSLLATEVTTEEAANIIKMNSLLEDM